MNEFMKPYTFIPSYQEVGVSQSYRKPVNKIRRQTQVYKNIAGGW